MDETSIVGVKVGQAAQISLDALPNSTIPGKVTAVAPVSTLQSGVVNYQVFVTLDTNAAATPRSSSGNRGSGAGGTRPGIPSQGTGGAATQGRPSGQSGGGTSTPGSPSGQTGGGSSTPGAAGNGQPISIPTLQLKSGMTAIAEIVTTTYDNVSLIPRQAVTGTGQNRIVKVLVDGQVQDRSVQLGANDDTNIMVLVGLSEGEKILITTAAPRSINPVSRPGGGMGGGGIIPGR